MSETVGYGIIRLSFPLAEHIMPEARIEETTLQRELRDTGEFEGIKQRLLLPASYEIQAIYIEYYKLCWIIVVQSPEIPVVEEGAELPHCTPIYTHTWDLATEDGIHAPVTALKEIRIERYDRVLKVD